jgi:hypothetical protein
MATYKVWLTVKDRYGNTKELDGGNINISQDKLTDEDINEIKNAIPVYVPNLEPDNTLVYSLEHGKTEDRLEFDIDKTNDWDSIDNTNGSSYVWEPMQ